jgi:hypothetical protein
VSKNVTEGSLLFLAKRTGVVNDSGNLRLPIVSIVVVEKHITAKEDNIDKINQTDD